MRVLASLFHPRGLWPFSGSERRFCSITREWAEAGVETVALEPQPLAREQIEAGYSPVPVPLPETGLIRQLAAWVLRAVDRGIKLGRRSRFDVVYATNNNLFNLLATAEIASRLSLPSVAVVHHLRWIDYRQRQGGASDGHLHVGRFLQALIEEGLPVPQALFRAAGAREEERLLTRIDAFTTVSRTVAAQLVQLVPEDAVFVTGNALSSRPRLTKSQTVRQQEAIFVGRLDEGKGIRDLVAVWEKVRTLTPGARLSIVGDGSLRRRVAKEVRQRNLESYVSIPGFVSDEVVESMRRRSRLFVTLSRTEGFGIAIGEALGDGLPVVAWDIPPLRELFGSCPAVFLCPEGDFERAASAVVSLLTMPEDQWQGVSGETLECTRRFSWGETAAAELKALETIVGEFS